MTPFELAVTETCQEILNSKSDSVAEYESILSEASSEVRAEVIKVFRTNESLQRLFPEKAVIFQESNFADLSVN